MKNRALHGAFILIVSGFICKIFGALFRLPLTNIIGVEGIGAFQMVMSLYSLTLVLITGGVTTSLSKLVSSARARGNLSHVRDYLKIALWITLIFALILSASFFLFANNIASVQGIPSGAGAYRLLIILLPLGAVIGVLRGIIQGYENMTPTAISQIIEQVIKFAFGLLFAYFMGAKRGVIGAFLGITLSEVLAFIYLLGYMIFKSNLPKASGENLTKPFLSAVIPLSLGGAVIPLSHAVDSLIIVSRLAFAGIVTERATALFGLQTGVVGAILNFPLIISLSVAMVILPKISYLSANGQVLKEKTTISSAFSVMWFLLLPLVLGIMALAKFIYPIIYPTAINGFLTEAVNLTLIGGLSVILSAIMQFLIAIAQAKGYFLFTALSCVVGGVIKVLIVIFTASIPAINIYSIPLSNIALCLVASIMLLIKLGDVVKINLFEFFIPLLSAFIMFLSIYIFSKFVELSPILMVVLCVGIGGVIYLTLNYPIIKSLYSRFFGKNKGREKGDEQE